MSSPHDALFKAVFGQPEHARGALAAVLPAVVREALDWEGLALVAGSFVDAELVGSHTDLLFSTRWREGGEALVYLVFEHQSSSDRWMAFRLLRYLVQIWERWIAEHPGAGRLPAIVPVVLYHGDAAWSATLAFEDLIDLPGKVREELEPQLVRLSYLVDDLSEIPDEALRGRAMSALGRLVQLCFKHARSEPQLLKLLERWASVVTEVLRARNGLEALTQVMRYILVVSEHVEPRALAALMERVGGPDAKDAIMTAGERLILQGEERGVRIGARALLLEQLQERFGPQVDATVEQRLAAASSDELRCWGKRVLSADSLGDIFRS